MMSGRFGASRGDVLRLFEGSSVAGLGDGELLERFVTRRDEVAFESLVSRLGPMVLGVCRRMLPDPHDVDDAFQATFLVLIRRAHAIRDRDLVGPWLHGVALKVARRARSDAARRAARERVAVVREEAQESPASLESEWPELRALIDEEIGRLPEHHRRPVVLCDVEGLSREEAALQLGWSLNMVRGRLERARDRLRGRLARRGLAPSGAWMALIVAPPTPPPALVASTIRAGLAFSVGRMGAGLASASAVALSQGVVRMMMLSKLKVGLALVLSTGFVAAGSGMLAAQGLGDKPAAETAKPVAQAPAPQGEAGPAKASDLFQPRSAADLAKARIDAALQRFKTQRDFYEEGRITADRLVDASRGLMQAERDAAVAKSGRVEAVRSHYERLKVILKREEAEFEVGKATTSDVTELKSALLDTEFELAKELEAPETKVSAPQNTTAFQQAIIDAQRSRRQAKASLEAFEQSSRKQVEADRKAGKSEGEAWEHHLDRVNKLRGEFESAFGALPNLTAPPVYKDTADNSKVPAVPPTAPPVAGSRSPDAPKVDEASGKERVEIARRLYNEAQRLFPGEIPVVDVLVASKTLLEAEEGVARTKAGKNAAVQAHINRLKGLMPVMEERVKRGEAKPSDRDRIRLLILDAESYLSDASSSPDGSVAGVTPAQGGPLLASGPGGSKASAARELTPLGHAVEAFNDRWGSNSVRLDQSPLTEDEVIAAIRFRKRTEDPSATDWLFAEFKKIAETRRLPSGSRFEVLHSMDPGEDFVFEGWWVRIVMESGNGGTYAFPIRSRLIQSVPLEEALSRTETMLRGPMIRPDRPQKEAYIKALKARIEERNKKAGAVSPTPF